MDADNQPCSSTKTASRSRSLHQLQVLAEDDPENRCPRTHGEYELPALVGAARIRQNHAKSFKDELRYVMAIVELEEGPRMMGNVTGIDPDDMQIGTTGRRLLRPGRRRLRRPLPAANRRVTQPA